MKDFFYQKMDDIYFDQLIKRYRLAVEKKNPSILVQKFFLPWAKFLTSLLRKELRINSNFFSNEKTFKV